MTLASLQLSTSGSWLVWLFWVATAACIGGAIICAGLLMEKLAGKQPAFFKKAKSLENWGELAVITGVVIEIISTGAFAIRGEIEMRHIREVERNTALQIAQTTNTVALVESNIAPRKFTNEQITYAHVLLSKYQETPFILESYSDPDSDRFGKKMEVLLEQVGWKEIAAISGGVTPFLLNGQTIAGIVRGREPNGVLIIVKNDKFLWAASTLDTFLDGCRIKSQFYYVTNSTWYPNVGDGVRVIIGTAN